MISRSQVQTIVPFHYGMQIIGIHRWPGSQTQTKGGATNKIGAGDTDKLPGSQTGRVPIRRQNDVAGGIVEKQVFPGLINRQYRALKCKPADGTLTATGSLTQTRHIRIPPLSRCGDPAATRPSQQPRQ